MRPFKQGHLDRCCAIYSVINALKLLNLDCNRAIAQHMYDFIVERLSRDDELFGVLKEGADHTVLSKIFEYTQAYIKENYNADLIVERPFYNYKGSFEDLTVLMMRYIVFGSSVLVRVKCSSFDHYSVVEDVSADKISFFDSVDMTSIKLKQISHRKGIKKHWLMPRNSYVMTVRECCKPQL